MTITRFVDVIVVRAIERHRTRVRFPGFHRASRRRADVRRHRLWCGAGFSCLAVHDVLPEKQKGHHPYRMMALVLRVLVLATSPDGSRHSNNADARKEQTQQ
jgi:hypothetical protein